MVQAFLPGVCTTGKNVEKSLTFVIICVILIWSLSETKNDDHKYPGVAKFGIALEWGSRGRWFESSHSDQKDQKQ